MNHDNDPGGIAIIGIALRLPGARSPVEFWDNLRAGVESIRVFSDDELLAAGIDDDLLRSAHYVKASPVIDGFDCFDAAFFNYSPKEAAIMDPQNRHFLEICWQALEDAGYDPERTSEAVVGVFAGAGSALTSYMLAYSGHPDMQGQTAGLQHINGDRDFLSTRVSFKLNLTGPSLTVQTACSTSLVAVHLACQSLQNGECDLALAGASTIRVPHISGYVAEPDSVHSADGHCRAFDATGRGTIFGSGIAAVVLKDLRHAIRDRDHVYAVIKGSAINNDGAAKISYTAASVRGQARAMVEALEVAGVRADTLQYVECHATGTTAGDPIEIQALTRAFRAHTSQRRFCAVGSVKTNIGHPEQSAGLAGLIKTALALNHRQIPASLHFVTPNPDIPFEDSPFYVQHQLAEWPGDRPRRAAVNSLGIGGTNAFVVLEEAPASTDNAEPLMRDNPDASENRSPSSRVFCLSAKTPAALRRRVEQFAAMLTAPAARPALDDLCYTANVSRSRLPRRFAAVVSTIDALRRALEAWPEGDAQPDGPAKSGPVAFLFSGQGAQYPGMSDGLYKAFPAYRRAFDQCDDLLRAHLDAPLRDLLSESRASQTLTDTGIVQPAIFAVEYALAQLWQSWGISPSAVMGHSVGELAAACVAGVFDLSGAIELVAARASLMRSITTPGAMLACEAGEDAMQSALRRARGRIGIAAINSPTNTVVSGEAAAIDAFRRRLGAAGVRVTPLVVSHAFHSALLDPVLPALEEAAARLTSRDPQLPMISNLTGQPLTAAPTPRYWRDHARQPVRFADGIRALYALGCRVFLEIGPGGAGIGAGRECLADADVRWLTSMGRNRDEPATLLKTLRTMYLDGASVNWHQVHEGQRRARVALPAYPFEPTRHWLEWQAPGLPRRTAPPDQMSSGPDDADDVRRAFHHLVWTAHRGSASATATRQAAGAWIVVADRDGVAASVVSALKRRGATVEIVRSGRADVSRLVLKALGGRRPGRTWQVLDLRGLDATRAERLSPAALARAERTVARTALPMVQAFANLAAARGARLWLVTRAAIRVSSVDAACEPVPALLWGLGRTAEIEAPSTWGGLIDLDGARRPAREEADELIDAIVQSGGETQLAIRDRARYVARLAPLDPSMAALSARPVRPDATYLITGGLGMMGLAIARWLVQARGARHVALVGRRGSEARVEAQTAALRSAGARVEIFRADVSRSQNVERLFRDMASAMPPIAGLVHCAGVLSDGIVGRMDEEVFTRVTAPKVRGAWLLHEHSKPLALDFFLVQSSLLSLTGSAGQANYTAANAFLDAFVDYRRSLGLPAMGINWGPWAGSGMAASSGARGQAIWQRRGVTLIDPSMGSRCLDVLFDGPVDHAVVVRCDWPRYSEQLPRTARLFESVAGSPRDSVASPTPGLDDWRARLAAAGPVERRALLVSALQQQLAKELGFERGIDTRQPLEQLGVDSLMSVSLANRLEASLGIRVPVLTLIKSPSLERLADELLSELPPATGASASDTVTRAESEPPIAAPGISITRGNGWLVFPNPNPQARLRLFCFNYAGGGAGTYRPWAELLSNEIELVAIEPPGRGARVDEPPFVRLNALLDDLMPELLPYLDKPAAVFGHCLGGLTMFEATRRALALGAEIRHVFVSGCRPPHALDALGEFEEALLSKLLADPAFDPLSPFHAQTDAIFARVIQQFDIGITDAFLAQPELRSLLLPAIRADFELAYCYRRTPEPPWDLPVTCFCGLDDTYVTREDALGWSRYTAREFRLHYRPGTHFLVAEDREFIVGQINHAMTAAAVVRDHVRVAR